MVDKITHTQPRRLSRLAPSPGNVRCGQRSQVGGVWMRGGEKKDE